MPGLPAALALRPEVYKYDPTVRRKQQYLPWQNAGWHVCASFATRAVVRLGLPRPSNANKVEHLWGAGKQATPPVLSTAMVLHVRSASMAEADFTITPLRVMVAMAQTYASGTSTTAQGEPAVRTPMALYSTDAGRDLLITRAWHTRTKPCEVMRLHRQRYACACKYGRHSFLGRAWPGKAPG